MRHIKEPMDSFTGGSDYGTEASYIFTPGPTIDEVQLFTTNLDADQVEVRMVLNGQDIVNVSGTDLQMLEAYKGNPTPAGIFVIPFADFDMRTQEGQSYTGLVTERNDNLVLKVKFGARKSPAQDGLSPTIRGRLVMRPAAPDGKRRILPRLYREVISAGATGENHYKTFNRGPRIRRMHALNPNLDNLRIVRDRVQVFNAAIGDNNFDLERAQLVPQSGVYHFDPLAYRFGLVDTLKTAGNSFEIIPNVTAAGDFPVIFETVEQVA